MSDDQDRATNGIKLPRRLVFRIPRTSLLAVLAVMAFAIPFASGWPPLWIIYIAPLAAGYAVLRWRTVADAEGLYARGLLRSTPIRWSELRSLRLGERSWVRAVLADDRQVVLPTVRLRHVPVLSLMSGGIIADPTERQAEQPSDSTTADEATDEATDEAADAGEVATEQGESPAPATAEGAANEQSDGESSAPAASEASAAGPEPREAVAGEGHDADRQATGE